MPYTNNDGKPYELDPLISHEHINKAVQDIATKINNDYKQVHLIGLLKGSFVFLSDLIRLIEIPVTMDFLAVSSYVGTQSSERADIR